MTLAEVTPSPTPDDVRDGGLVDAVLTSERGAVSARRSSSDGTDLLITQRGHSMTLAARQTLRLSPRVVSVSSHQNLWVRTRDVAIATGRSVLGLAVRHVQEMCAQEEMRNADARRVVTSVTHEDASGNHPASHLPSKAVSGHKANPVPEQAVAPTPERTSPRPAARRLLDLLPEQFCSITHRARSYAFDLDIGGA